MYKIHEIFHSIQGEGLWTGTSMIFIRFAGCNLKCPWCDTEHEKVDVELTDEELVAYIGEFHPQCKRVCLTGGEPMLQCSRELSNMLYYGGYSVHIETNGTIKTDPDMYTWLTVSPKVSEGAEWNQRKGDELKVIWAGCTIEELEKYFDSNFRHYYLQPQAGYLDIPLPKGKSRKRLDKLLNIIREEPKWRLSLQTQRFLGAR